MNPNVFFEMGNTQIQARLLSLLYDKTSLEKNPWEYRRNRLYRKQYKNQNDLYYNKPIYRQETIFQTSIGFDKIKDPETLVLLELYSHWPGHGTTIYLYLVFFYYMCMQLHVDSKLSHWKCT